MQPQPGQLITAPFLPAPAEVKKFEPRAGYFLLKVVLQDGPHTYRPLCITAEQLTQVRTFEKSHLALTGNAEDYLFLIEAHRNRDTRFGPLIMGD